MYKPDPRAISIKFVLKVSMETLILLRYVDAIVMLCKLELVLLVILAAELAKFFAET